MATTTFIGFWYEKDSAVEAGKKAFIVNRVGDFCFLIALFMIFFHFGSLDFGVVLPRRLGMSFADNLVTLDDNATDPRVRRRDEKPFGRPVQGMRNTLQIIENFHESLLKM